MKLLTLCFTTGNKVFDYQYEMDKKHIENFPAVCNLLLA
jgi:hypothetical protein